MPLIPVTLHAYWHRDRLVLWGERAGDAGTALATADELRAVVGELSSDALLASIAVQGRQRLWLPSDAGGGPIGCAAASARLTRGDGREHGSGADVATLVGELRAIDVTT